MTTTQTPIAPTSTSAVNSARRRRRKQRIAQGLPATILVDAQPVRDHIDHLRGEGMSIADIAKAAGVDYKVITRVLYAFDGYPPSQRLQADNATAVLAVRPQLQLLSRIPVVGTQRRLRALVAQGWSFTRLSAELGWTDRNLAHQLYRDGVVYADTHRKVCAAYDRLRDHPPAQDTLWQRASVTRARNIATREGWAPSGAWDDVDIDEPAAEPDWSALRGRKSRLTPDEVLEEWEQLRGEVRWRFFHERVGLSYGGWSKLFSDAAERGDPRAVKHPRDEPVRHWRAKDNEEKAS